MAALELRNPLQEFIQHEHTLQPTLLFDYPTISSLSDYLLSLSQTDKLEARPRAEQVTNEDEEKEKAEQDQQGDRVAIVGIGCKFPGMANDPFAYFQMLRDGYDAIEEIPQERNWDMENIYDSNSGISQFPFSLSLSFSLSSYTYLLLLLLYLLLSFR